MASSPGPVVAIMGATATGKSSVAVRMAECFDGEIVSMDSRQVYRGMDIGTAKVPEAERRLIPHHLIDILDPSESNSAGFHVTQVKRIVGDICSRRRLPILVGGTGLYFRAFFSGLIDVAIPEGELESIRDRLESKKTADLYRELEHIDAPRAREISARDRIRIMRALEVYLSTGKTHTRHLREQASPERSDDLKVVLTMPREMLRRRISERTRDMYRAGWVSEVRDLLEGGYNPTDPGMNSLGYQAIATAIREGSEPDATVDRVITLTQQYAKRQETFFRGIPDALWVDVSRDDAPVKVEGLIRQWQGL